MSPDDIIDEAHRMKSEKYKHLYNAQNNLETVRDFPPMLAVKADVKLSEDEIKALTHGRPFKENDFVTLPESTFKDSGERREFGTGAVRDKADGKGRFDLLPLRALREVARVMEEGAKKYNDRNWEKGIKLSAFADSMQRHYTKFMLGHTDEPHLSMMCWNALCLLDTVIRIKEGGNLDQSLVDIPVDIGNISTFFKGIYE